MRTTKRTPVAASRRPPIAFAWRVPIRSYRLRYNRMAIPPSDLTGAARIRDAAAAKGARSRMGGVTSDPHQRRRLSSRADAGAVSGYVAARGYGHGADGEGDNRSVPEGHLPSADPADAASLKQVQRVKPEARGVQLAGELRFPGAAAVERLILDAAKIRRQLAAVLVQGADALATEMRARAGRPEDDGPAGAWSARPGRARA